MLLAVKLQPGVIFDLRAALLAIIGLFGGPYAALIAGGVAAAYRILLGGDGMTAGLTVIGSTTAAGLVAHHFMSCEYPKLRVVVLLGCGVGVIALAVMGLLPSPLFWQALTEYGIPVALLSVFATITSSVVIIHAGLMRNERSLLRTAIVQAPDFFYIKDRNSRFVAVNEAVAAYNRVDRPSDLTGKSDFDIASPERARELFQAEQEIVRSQQPIIDCEELITDREGAERFFVTTKVPIHSKRQGDPVFRLIAS